MNSRVQIPYEFKGAEALRIQGFKVGKLWRMSKRARLEHEADAAKATVVVDLVDGAADSHLKQPKIARVFNSGAPDPKDLEYARVQSVKSRHQLVKVRPGGPQS